MDDTPCDPRPIVAATLRTVAEWGLSFEEGLARDELRDIADQVALVEPGDMCCPVCEEVECDEGCPLAEYRAGVTDT